MSEDTVKKPSLSILSNKRLNEIKEVLIRRYGSENIDATINDICEIMKFDHDYAKNKYTQEKGRKNAEYMRRKAQELGTTQYQLFKKGSKV